MKQLFTRRASNAEKEVPTVSVRGWHDSGPPQPAALPPRLSATQEAGSMPLSPATPTWVDASGIPATLAMPTMAAMRRASDASEVSSVATQGVSFERRRAELLKLAREQRRGWLMEALQQAPRFITKDDVLAVVKPKQRQNRGGGGRGQFSGSESEGSAQPTPAVEDDGDGKDDGEEDGAGYHLRGPRLSQYLPAVHLASSVLVFMDALPRKLQGFSGAAAPPPVGPLRSAFSRQSSFPLDDGDVLEAVAEDVEEAPTIPASATQPMVDLKPDWHAAMRLHAEALLGLPPSEPSPVATAAPHEPEDATPTEAAPHTPRASPKAGTPVRSLPGRFTPAVNTPLPTSQLLRRDTPTEGTPGEAAASEPGPLMDSLGGGALDAFTERLSDPAAVTVVEALRGFVNGFKPEPTHTASASRSVNSTSASTVSGGHQPPPESDDDDEDYGFLLAPHRSEAPTTADRVRSFLTRMEETMRGHAVWRDVSGDEEWDEVVEALERFVMSKLHDEVFGVYPRAVEKDAKLASTLDNLSFISFRHLDMPRPPSRQTRGWLLAQAALRDMHKFRAPCDKLACLMNCCRTVSALLEDMGKAGKSVGADEFLPALIYTVLKANPPQLASTMRFIGEYRNPGKLLSEQGYFFTNLISAVSFLRNVDAATLSISNKEFEEGVSKARNRAERVRRGTIQRGISIQDVARQQGGLDIKLHVDALDTVEGVSDMSSFASSEDERKSPVPDDDGSSAENGGDTGAGGADDDGGEEVEPPPPPHLVRDRPQVGKLEPFTPDVTPLPTPTAAAAGAGATFGSRPSAPTPGSAASGPPDPEDLKAMPRHRRWLHHTGPGLQDDQVEELRKKIAASKGTPYTPVSRASSMASMLPTSPPAAPRQVAGGEIDGASDAEASPRPDPTPTPTPESPPLPVDHLPPTPGAGILEAEEDVDIRGDPLLAALCASMDRLVGLSALPGSPPDLEAASAAAVAAFDAALEKKETDCSPPVFVGAACPPPLQAAELPPPPPAVAGNVDWSTLPLRTTRPSAAVDVDAVQAALGAPLQFFPAPPTVTTGEVAALLSQYEELAGLASTLLAKGGRE